MAKRIDKLTDAQAARMQAHADEWIGIGLRTGAADHHAFENAAKRCYAHAGIPWPNLVVWVPSPIIMAIAAPVAALVIQMRRKGGAVGDAVRDAVSGAVGDAVRDAVSDAVRDADAKKIRKAVADVIAKGWSNYIGGQFWAGGYWWGGSFTSFFREVCSLELTPDLWARGLAYEDTIKSACWWYPHKDFVMGCERPTVIHREQIAPRGWGSHRLHCADGPAVAWPDGWGVYSYHGVRVPRDVIEDRQSITVRRIRGEKNAEVRRVMVELYGYDRYCLDAGLTLVDQRPADDSLVGLRTAKLWRDESDNLTLLDMLNSTPEPDGSIKRYVLSVDGQAYGERAGKDCLAAMASTWRNSDYTLAFATPEEYRPMAES